jgi:TonB family protein
MRKIGVAIAVFVLSYPLAATLVNPEVASTPSFQPATVVSTVDPVYPVNSTSSGTVLLSVGIDAGGEISDVKVIQSAGAFESSALDAVHQWKFKAATLDGQPVASAIPVALSFAWPAICAGGGRRRGK